MLIGIPLGMAFGLGVAMLLDAKVKGMSVYRTLFYLPSIVPGVASALLWILHLQSQQRHPELGAGTFWACRA